MRFLKSHPVLSLANSFLIDSPLPSNITYLWNFGSLLGLCLVIQIVTGVTLAMHYAPSTSLAFVSVEHIMRDVFYGWLIRYAHANGASFFFICVYIHMARGLYFNSYTKPRVLLWSVGVVIYILMMANFGPKCIDFDILFLSTLPFSTPRVASDKRIGPHCHEALSIIISGLVGDWWGSLIKSKNYTSVRFMLEQDSKNSQYINYINKKLIDIGYCPSQPPKVLPKTLKGRKWENLRISTFAHTSLTWIYDDFYHIVDGKLVKRIPSYLPDYLTPFGLAMLIQEDGSRQMGQGVNIATNCFTYNECVFLANILNTKFKLTTSVISAGAPNQWRVSIWKESMPLLREIVGPYIVPDMAYKLMD